MGREALCPSTTLFLKIITNRRMPASHSFVENLSSEYSSQVPMNWRRNVKWHCTYDLEILKLNPRSHAPAYLMLSAVANWNVTLRSVPCPAYSCNQFWFLFLSILYLLLFSILFLPNFQNESLERVFRNASAVSWLLTAFCPVFRLIFGQLKIHLENCRNGIRGSDALVAGSIYFDPSSCGRM